MRGHPLTYPLWITIGALAICLAWAPFGDSDQVAMLATVALIILGYSGFRLSVALAPVRRVSGQVPVRRIRQQHRLLSRSWLELDTAGGRRWLPVYFDPALVTLPSTTAEFGRNRVELLDTGQPETTATEHPGVDTAGQPEPDTSEQPKPDTAAPLEASSAQQPEVDAAVGEPPTGTSTLSRLRVYPSGPLRNSEPVGRLVDNPSRPTPDGAERAAAASRPRRRLLLDAQSVVAAPILGLLWIYTDGGGFPAFAGATTVAAAAAVWFAAIRGSDPS
ncbi:hypothetical protein [Nocardia stercoris]|uniref:Uncharacterized protein n=1 Tax=Nocardia stercoris TaxID=2483361 RepID=A0A3M2L9C0_9NOCA|nr:hypothetical protein [Nocardia stercoris]RMI34192.1 hypothetical protein EBN03_07170 [Nocardia stercoris]